MSPSARLRRATAPLFALALLPCTSACWLAARTAVAALPIVTQTVASKRTADTVATRRPGAAHVVPDRGLTWERTLLGGDGRPLDPATYAPGEPAILRWRVPVQIAPGVEAVVGLATAETCRRPDAVAPARWALQRDDDGGPAEAWFVSRAAWAVRGGATNQRTLGWGFGDQMRTRLGLAPRDEVSWLLVVPQPGRYVLTVDYEAGAPTDLAAAAPCIGAWTDVPLGWAVTATAGAAGPSGTPPRRVGAAPAPDVVGGGLTPSAPAPSGGTPGAAGRNTSDEGASAAPAGERAPARASEPAAPPPSAGTWGDAVERVTRELGLLSVPEYDLIRLHQIAVAFEVARQSPGGEGGDPRAADPDYRNALRLLRQDRLARLASDALTGRPKLCDLLSKHGLGVRTFWLWADEATIPEPLQTGCRPDLLGIPVPPKRGVRVAPTVPARP